MLSSIVLMGMLMHPFHISVSDVKYKEDQKAIQISTRIFLDDLALALTEYTGREKLDLLDESEWEFINTTLRDYLKERISMKDEKNKAYQIMYVGAEIEQEVMWCYLEVEKVKKLKSIHIKNSILHEVWPDQENLIHFRAFNKVKSARLLNGEDTKEFSWD